MTAARRLPRLVAKSVIQALYLSAPSEPPAEYWPQSRLGTL